MPPRGMGLSLASLELARESGFLFSDVRQQGALSSASTRMLARDVVRDWDVIDGTAVSVHLTIDTSGR